MHSHHPESHTHTHGNTAAMPTAELDDLIAASVERQSQYDNWKATFVGKRLKAGLHTPQGMELKIAWNNEQKRQAKEKKLLAQMDYYHKELHRVKAELGIINGEYEEELPDFDAIDRDMQRQQEAREMANQMAHKEQTALLNPHSGEDTKPHNIADTEEEQLEDILPEKVQLPSNW